MHKIYQDLLCAISQPSGACLKLGRILRLETNPWGSMGGSPIHASPGPIPHRQSSGQKDAPPASPWRRRSFGDVPKELRDDVTLPEINMG